MELRVETGISFGNACDLAVERSAGGWKVAFSPDPHGGPESLWFCFRLAVEGNTEAGSGKVELVLVNAPTVLGGGSYAGEDRGNMRPVARRMGGEKGTAGSGQAGEQLDGRVDVAWEAGLKAGFPTWRCVTRTVLLPVGVRHSRAGH